MYQFILSGGQDKLEHLVQQDKGKGFGIFFIFFSTRKLTLCKHLSEIILMSDLYCVLVENDKHLLDHYHPLGKFSDKWIKFFLENRLSIFRIF